MVRRNELGLGRLLRRSLTTSGGGPGHHLVPTHLATRHSSCTNINCPIKRFFGQLNFVSMIGRPLIKLVNKQLLLLLLIGEHVRIGLGSHLDELFVANHVCVVAGSSWQLVPALSLGLEKLTEVVYLLTASSAIWLLIQRQIFHIQG